MTAHPERISEYALMLIADLKSLRFARYGQREGCGV
jgi:hypothetical protein